MNIIQTVRQYLINVSGVTDLVGTRIYPEHLPQTITKPAIVLREVSGDSEQHLTDLSGLGYSRVRAQCYAETEAAAVAVRDAVRISGLATHRGTVDGVWLCGATIEGRGLGADPPADGSDTWDWYAWLDFRLSYEETIS